MGRVWPRHSPSWRAVQQVVSEHDAQHGIGTTTIEKDKLKTILIAGLCVLSFPISAASTLWSSSSKDFGESRSDFLLREVERRPRSSVLQIEIRNVGGSVGSSMMIACMLARLAEERGGYRYLIKVDSRASNATYACPEHLRIVLISVSAIALAWFLAACVRAVLRSRRLHAQLRRASPEERRQFEARMEAERELAAYAVPLRAWEYVPGLCGVVGLVLLKVGGYL